MTDATQGRQRNRNRLWWALALAVALLALLILPPYISISRYKSQIAHLMAASLGRPVRLSSVQLRLLPRPGFVLTDLTVEEDPAFGAEPVLHADSVTASFRFFSLWRGRLVISRISVDQASVNLVRNAAGSWNLDALLRSPAIQPAQGMSAPQHRDPLPTLVATNSRINIKNGAEKLPFSLVNTDVEFWQTDPGAWRIQLRGQPARTDVNLDLADTGVVRLDASLRRAGPSTTGSAPSAVHLDMDWREAQLGQLARLITGSDPGWRGDLTGELHLDGTTEEAQIKSRLRASSVHRAEFAPVVSMDFDANCTMVYRRALQALDNLACDSPLGAGRIHLAGNLPGMAGTPHFSLELDRVPVAAGLDALRTVRRGLAPGLVAKGAVSGKMTYDAAKLEIKPVEPRHEHAAKGHQAAPDPLAGSFTVEGLELSGDALGTPLQAAKFVLEPASAAEGSAGPALAATTAIAAGGAGPLTIVSHLAPSGYQLAVHGQASMQRAKELAQLAGMAGAAGLDALAGDPVSVILKADGPWMPKEKVSFAAGPPAIDSAMGLNPTSNEAGTGDSFTGVVTLHNANWKADYLASHVMISQATLHFSDSELRWDPVDFSYGPLKATATVALNKNCDPAAECPAKIAIQFGDLDSGELQASILGAHERGTLLSELLNRLHSSAPPSWPAIDATVKADSFQLGPVTLNRPAATLRIVPTGAEISRLDATMMGGQVHASGTLRTPIGDTGKSGDNKGEAGKPAYAFECKFDKLSASAIGELLGMHWTGSAFDAEGKIDLSGFTAAQLSDSAKGTLHFEWHHGQIGSQGADRRSASSKPELLPAALARFDRWTADAEIANGAVTLKQSQVVQGARRQTVEGSVVLANPLKVSFAASNETEARR